MRRCAILVRLLLVGCSAVSSFIHLRGATVTLNQAQRWPESKPYSVSNSVASRTQLCPYWISSVTTARYMKHENWDGYDTAQIITQLGFGQRLVVLDSTNLPRPAEFYSQGKWGLCLITGFKYTNTSAKPLVEILVVNATSIDGETDYQKQIVDMGQITTIWDNLFDACESGSSSVSYLIYLQKTYREAFSSIETNFPINHFDACMEKMHLNHQKSRPGHLKNKNSISSKINVNHPVQEIIRNVQKAGPRMTRLIDSKEAIDYIYHHMPSSIDTNMDIKIIVGAEIIYRDFVLGGRFKRFPSIYVQQQDSYAESNTTATSICHSPSVTIINGGWLVLDPSSRATMEGQKFAERIHTYDLTKTPQGLTVADERILYRLESLAMGEIIHSSTAGAEYDASQLEIDVRQTLSALNLPLSPEGARMALIQIGKWSESKVTDSSRALNTSDTFILNPWSKEILSAAKYLSTYVKRKREQLLAESDVMHFQGSKTQMGGRSDLTLLPVVCIDAQRTTFRDDAISVRPRSRTGRKVINECKWELLIHIADVSDIYCPDVETVEDFSILRKAAESRCMSRYDLPIGPLHLMPPQALEALSFECRKTDHREFLTTNTCVTVWVYLEEESGKILDSGVERSVIGPPTSLTFDVATKLLEVGVQERDGSHFQRSAQVLKIAERLLSTWNFNQVQNNLFARNRDERLNARQQVAESILDEEEMTDDGSQGSFRRSRGHRIVDTALDLYSFVLSNHLAQAKVPFPRLAGNGVDRRGRMATAPLRRYLDGLVQRQVLSSMCNYGGSIMNRDECSVAGKTATEVVNKIRNIRWDKGGRTMALQNEANHKGFQILQNHLHRNGSSIMPAVSTGKENEVIILGSGLKVKCDGVRGTLRPGDRILVQISKLDTKKGFLRVHLYEN